MKKLFLGAPFFMMIGSGCSIFQSDEDSLPNKFNDQSTYKLSDFQLNGD